jgi:hypothetical protein
MMKESEKREYGPARVFAALKEGSRVSGFVILKLFGWPVFTFGGVLRREGD